MKNPLRALDDALLTSSHGRRERRPTPRRRTVLLTGGGLLVVVLVLVAVLVVVSRSQQDSGGARDRAVTSIGPRLGASIATYAAQSRSQLDALAGSSQSPTYALVSLSGYGTPQQVATLLAGIAAAQAFLRVPLKGRATTVEHVPVTTLPASLITAMAGTATALSGQAAQATKTAKALSGNDAQEQALRAYYATQSALLTTQAKALASSACPCVWAVVVRATPQALVGLRGRTGVRVVEAAPGVTDLRRASFAPVLPDATTTVQAAPTTAPPTASP